MAPREPHVLRFPLCLLQPLPSVFLIGSRHHLHTSCCAGFDSAKGWAPGAPSGSTEPEPSVVETASSIALRVSLSLSLSPLSRYYACPLCSSPRILTGFRYVILVPGMAFSDTASVSKYWQPWHLPQPAHTGPGPNPNISASRYRSPACSRSPSPSLAPILFRGSFSFDYFCFSFSLTFFLEISHPF